MSENGIYYIAIIYLIYQVITTLFPKKMYSYTGLTWIVVSNIEVNFNSELIPLFGVRFVIFSYFITLLQGLFIFWMAWGMITMYWFIFFIIIFINYLHHKMQVSFEFSSALRRRMFHRMVVVRILLVTFLIDVFDFMY